MERPAEDLEHRLELGEHRLRTRDRHGQRAFAGAFEPAVSTYVMRFWASAAATIPAMRGPIVEKSTTRATSLP